MPRNLNRLLALSLTLLGVSVPTSAHADLAGDLARCRSVADSAQRLACFDALATVPASQEPLSFPTSQQRQVGEQVIAPVPAQVSGAGASDMKEQSFGAEALRKESPGKEAETLSARLLDRLDGVHRSMLFRLDNGQIWKNIDDREHDYEADYPAVTIERNYIGSYWMQLTDAKFRVRVRRIR